RDHGSQELLLPRDAREVRNAVALHVSRANEREGLESVQVVTTGMGKIELCECIDHGTVDAYGNPAQRVHDSLKPGEVHSHQMADPQSADAIDRRRDA